MRTQVRDFIVGQPSWRGPASDLTDDYPLVEKKVLDSMAIFELVAFIEQSFGIEIEDEELVSENFATLKAIDRLDQLQARHLSYADPTRAPTRLIAGPTRTGRRAAPRLGC